MRMVTFIICIFLFQIVNADTQIPSLYIRVAQINKVPPKLFFALILTESRSVSGTKGNALPWPWVINHRGTPHFFQTREEAYNYATKIDEGGDKQFDVGLGQLNWRWHQHRFLNLWDAFDPEANLTAAAKFLREQYERKECDRWELAIGCYHRPSQSEKNKYKANQYTHRVISIWKTL